MVFHDLEEPIPLSEPYHLVICTFVFMFIQHRKQLAEEIYRLTALGGFVIIEINPKKLAYGYPIHVGSLVDLFQRVGFTICYTNQKYGFIARKENMTWRGGEKHNTFEQ